jgi:3-(3-hydroxy-phenyl)propionate hydroxylase
MQIQGFAGIPLDISDFPTSHNCGLALRQSHFRAHTGRLVGELGCRSLVNVR